MSKDFVEIELPQQKSCGGVLFPGVVSPDPSLDISEFVELVKEQREWVESLLLARGAVLFRGSPVKTAEDFNQVLHAFGYEEFPYVGGVAPRTHVVDRVYTANDSKDKIQFHHEMAYVPAYPKKLFFYCLEEPKRGGETPIVVSNLVYEKMKEKYPEFVEKLEKLQVNYTRVAGEEDDPSCIGRSWHSLLQTTDKSIAEERAAPLGVKLEWLENGVKIINGPMPAIRVHPTTGQKTWFNSMAVAYTTMKDARNGLVEAITFGDGTPMPDDIFRDCLKIMEEESVAIPWKKGDILLLDNLSVLHSRRSFDPHRRILASLCK